MNRHLPSLGLSNVSMPYPLKAGMEFFEDFIGWGTSLISATAGAAPWRAVGTNVTATDFLGTNGIAADGDVAGLCQITVSSGASGDESIMQLNGALLCATGRPMEFQCRVRVESITTAGQLAGMYAAATDPWTQQNGFGFRIVNGAIGYEVKNAGTTLAVTTTGKSVAASTTTGWLRLKAIWNGATAITFYVDDVLVATYTGAAIPTALYLTPTIGVGATGTVNPVLTVDYIACSVEGATR